MIKERPILYSTPMIQAKLAGTKTQTRRIMKVQPEEDCYFEMKLVKKVGGGLACMIDYNQGDKNPFVKCPYGNIGDLLWARESWAYSYHWQAYLAAGFDVGPYDYENHPIYIYKADHPDIKGWKPSIHMPKVAARIWERITDIRVERLQAISEEDAIAEGIEVHHKYTETAYRNYLIKDDAIFNARYSYQTLWESINGLGSWEVNSWVWVVTSEILSTTGRPKGLAVSKTERV